MILTLFTKLQSVTLEHPDRSEEVIFQLVMLGQIFAFFSMKIVDTITQHIQTRFSDFVRIRFLDLLDSSKYREYQKAFPEKSFKCLLDTYGFAFDEILLRTNWYFCTHWLNFKENLQLKCCNFSPTTLLQKLLYRKFILLCSLITVIHSDVGGGGGHWPPAWF